MTASMDEAGLAAFMIKIGNNPARIKAILERLLKRHYSDSDDVALLYTEKAPDALLRSLKQSDPSVIDLFVKCLETGWTTARENRAVAKLRAA